MSRRHKRNPHEDDEDTSDFSLNDDASDDALFDDENDADTPVASSSRPSRSSSRRSKPSKSMKISSDEDDDNHDDDDDDDEEESTPKSRGRRASSSRKQPRSPQGKGKRSSGNDMSEEDGDDDDKDDDNDEISEDSAMDGEEEELLDDEDQESFSPSGSEEEADQLVIERTPSKSNSVTRKTGEKKSLTGKRKKETPRKSAEKTPRTLHSKKRKIISDDITSGDDEDISAAEDGQWTKGSSSASGGQSSKKRALTALQSLGKEAASASAVKTLDELGYNNVTEVHELAPTTVMKRVEDVIIRVAQSIMQGNAFEYRIPNRSSSNQIYIQELDRIVLLDKISTRAFLSSSSIRKTVIMTRVMQLVHEVLRRNIHTTKRDLFYTDVKLFKGQNESDAVLDDVACLAGCTRTSLHVVASEKGVVVGRLQFREDGDEIDCSKMGVGGKAIPPYIDRITDLRSDAQFILLVEKDAAFMRLAEDRFYNKYPCIILTAKGQPDVATRLFLKNLRSTLKIPVLGLVDSDPYGLKILSVYLSGSKNMSYDSASLTTPDIKWLGIRPSDLDKYNIPEQCRLKMTAGDIKTGKDMLKEDFILKNPQWHEELQHMIKRKEKAEIQSLSAYGFQYLTETYLPAKLKEGDWI